ncbi:MAG: IS110 family transposase [Chloroflexota bacterium]
METATARSANYTTNSQVLYLAFELSNNKWNLGFTIGLGQKPRERVVPARDLPRVLEEISAAKQRFKLPEATRVVSCYEAGRDGFWLHRALVAAGVESLVVDSSSIEVNRRARRAKTDRLDLGKLVTMLIRYHSGETKVWSVVQVPEVKDEDQRQLHRELADLKTERTRETNRIKGLLIGQGISLTTRGQAKIDLDAVRLWDQSPLPEGIRGRIQRAQERVEFLSRQIRELETQRDQELENLTCVGTKRVRQLMVLKGIGPVTAWVLVMEFFGWRRFRNRRQVGALSGLAPSPYQSGDSAREQGISKSGNRRVRARAIEMAWLWVRYQPGSALSRWFQKRFGAGGSRQRRIGIVALARKLLVGLWRYVETGAVPDGAKQKVPC